MQALLFACHRCGSGVSPGKRFCGERCAELARQTNEKCRDTGMEPYYPENYQLPLFLEGS